MLPPIEGPVDEFRGRVGNRLPSKSIHYSWGSETEKTDEPFRSVRRLNLWRPTEVVRSFPRAPNCEKDNDFV